MATSTDHPELTFVQAKSYARGRTGAPLWIVVHDMEAGEHSSRAENTAAYFATLTDGRSVSSHYCVDSDSVVQCVLLKDTAHTTGGNPGNPRGINWELAGFARQSRAEWLDAFGLAMFRQMAPIVRADAKRFGIPLERRTIAELKAFKPGITSHNDIRVAFGGTTHTDPGAHFPWDVFLQMVREEMGDDDVSWTDKLGPTNSTKSRWPTAADDTAANWLMRSAMYAWDTQARIDVLSGVIRDLADALKAGGGSVDTAAILSGVDERLAAFRAQVEADTRDAVADLAEGGAEAVRADT